MAQSVRATSYKLADSHDVFAVIAIAVLMIASRVSFCSAILSSANPYYLNLNFHANKTVIYYAVNAENIGFLPHSSTSRFFYEMRT